ncbi:MAG TPA: hypothetical protein PLU30_12765 [Verrucomicrobiae bacterium]|nr:hypothetical protein [Verrucomicrobiae bacterium]
MAPGDTTGFTRPWFVWRLPTSGDCRVRIELADPGSAPPPSTTAIVSRSPMPFSGLDSKPLQPGVRYRLTVEPVSGVPAAKATREFLVVTDASDGPAPLRSVDTLLEQVARIKAAGRPADALMLILASPPDVLADERVRAKREAIEGGLAN